jgi:hypothetical protein
MCITYTSRKKCGCTESTLVACPYRGTTQCRQTRHGIEDPWPCTLLQDGLVKLAKHGEYIDLKSRLRRDATWYPRRVSCFESFGWVGSSEHDLFEGYLS